MIRSTLIKISFILITLISFSTSALAQFTSDATKRIDKTHYKLYSSEVRSSLDTIQLESPVTSITLEINKSETFDKAFIIAENDTFPVSEDFHQEAEGATKFSGLIIFPSAIDSFIFSKGKIAGKVNYHFFNSGKTPKINFKDNSRRINEVCGVPMAIDQSVWREGLPSPTASPNYADVKHIIIHHSAGSNTNTDYTYVVRQIYLYHVEGRGYSDIAYNFLIAQDGTIFQGRQGAGENEEDAIGAHFCAKNTGTMGICLLGDYEKVEPTSATISSLENLMAWKLKKENLDPLKSLPHPANSTNNLGVIAGHRDGCSTECPGKNVYVKIGEIKQRTAAKMQTAGGEIAVPTIVRAERKGPGKLNLQVEGDNNDTFQWFTSPNLKDSIPGEHSYIFVTPYLSSDSTFYVARKVGACRSQIIPITAKISIEEVSVFPNPASSELNVLLDDTFDISSLDLTTSAGRSVNTEIEVKDKKYLTVATSHLAAGVYILTLKSSTKTIIKRILVI